MRLLSLFTAFTIFLGSSLSSLSSFADEFELESFDFSTKVDGAKEAGKFNPNSYSQGPKTNSLDPLSNSMKEVSELADNVTSQKSEKVSDSDGLVLGLAKIASDIGNGDLLSDKRTGQLTNEGLKVLNDFCSDLENSALFDKNFEQSFSKLSEPISATIATNPVVRNYPDTLSMLKTAAKNTYSAICKGEAPGSCSREKFKDKKTFAKACEDNFRVTLDLPVFNLDHNYNAQIASNLPDKKYRGTTEYRPENDCSGGKNCYFTSGNNGKSSCDPFGCSMADRDSLDKSTFAPVQVYLLSSPEYSFEAESSGGCENCFLEQVKLAEGVSPSVARDRLKAEEKNSLKMLENQLTGAKAGKALLELSAGLENLFDLSKLYPKSSAKIEQSQICVNEIDNALARVRKSRCSGRLSHEDLKMRMEAAKQTANVKSLSGDYITKHFLNEANPKNSQGASCSREDFAITAAAQWRSLRNQEYRKSLKVVVDQLEGDKEIDKICAKGNFPDESVTQRFVKNTLSTFWEKNEQRVQRLINSGAPSEEVVKSLCHDNASKKGLICGGKSLFLLEMGNAQQETLSRRVSGQRLEMDSFKNLVSQIAGAKVESLMEVPMQLDPVLRMSFSNWNTFCELSSEHDRVNKEEFAKLDSEGKAPMFKSRRTKLSDYINSLTHRKGDFNLVLKNFSNSICNRVEKELESALCHEGGLQGQRGEEIPYSLDDIKVAKKRLSNAPRKNIVEKLSLNSLACKYSAKDRSEPGMFSAQDQAQPEIRGSRSSYEQRLASEQRERDGIVRNKLESPFSFNNWERCSKQSSNLYAKALAASDPGTEIQPENRGNHSSIGELIGDVINDLGHANENAENDFRDFIENSGIGSLPFGDGPKFPSNQMKFSEKEVSGEIVGTTRSLASSQSFKNKMEIRSEGEQVQAASSRVASGTMNTAYGNQSGEDSFQTSSIKIQENCDLNCLKSIIKAPQVVAAQPSVAEKIGVRGIQESSQDLKKVFEDVLKGDSEDQKLANLKEDNDKLRQEMVEIKKSIASGQKPVKVLDINGKDRSGIFRAPAKASSVVFNPRNHEENEFRSRGYFADRMEEFSPSFNSSGSKERVSLGSYSESRRSAVAKTKVAETGAYNADIDKTFLQANPVKVVDESFIEKYVEHVDRNAGSIEHLVVFKNGKPAIIRVPDPERPGNYIEHPLKGDMVGKILQKVEEDEVESFSIYNMVSFGESLEEFMSGLNNEAANIATLDTLNKRLEKLRMMQ